MELKAPIANKRSRSNGNSIDVVVNKNKTNEVKHAVASINNIAIAIFDGILGYLSQTSILESISLVSKFWYRRSHAAKEPWYYFGGDRFFGRNEAYESSPRTWNSLLGQERMSHIRELDGTYLDIKGGTVAIIAKYMPALTSLQLHAGTESISPIDFILLSSLTRLERFQLVWREVDVVHTVLVIPLPSSVKLLTLDCDGMEGMGTYCNVKWIPSMESLTELNLTQCRFIKMISGIVHDNLDLVLPNVRNATYYTPRRMVKVLVAASPSLECLELESPCILTLKAMAECKKLHTLAILIGNFPHRDDMSHTSEYKQLSVTSLKVNADIQEASIILTEMMRILSWMPGLTSLTPSDSWISDSEVLTFVRHAITSLPALKLLDLHYINYGFEIQRQWHIEDFDLLGRMISSRLLHLSKVPEEDTESDIDDTEGDLD